MSLCQLEYFVAVAEEGHLTRAAKRLHISQPPLSRQIRGLEEELGARLFERTPRGMVLLPTGARFLEHARRVLAAVADARRSITESETERKFCDTLAMVRENCAHPPGGDQ